MNTFSIIMPAHNQKDGQQPERMAMMNRAIRSIVHQSYPHWELIVVNDGSDQETYNELEEWKKKDERIKVIHNDRSYNRAICRNKGMELAKNDWLCWLDSDDEYVSHYLRACDKMINDFPEYKVFNFGAIIMLPLESRLRDSFKPRIIGNGHEWFKAGGINTGSFIFRKDLWESDVKYRIPDEESPYAFAATSKFDMKLPADTPEIEHGATGAFADGKLRVGVSLGNPWGDDMLQFYKLTRDNISKPIDIHLYVIYPRNSEDCFSYF